MPVIYKCPDCGNEVQLGSRFCSDCGAKLIWPKKKNNQPTDQQDSTEKASQSEIVKQIPISPENINLFCKKGIYYCIVMIIFGSPLISGIILSSIYDIKCWLYNTANGQLYKNMQPQDVINKIKTVRTCCYWQFALDVLYIIELILAIAVYPVGAIVRIPLFIPLIVTSILLFNRTKDLILQSQAGELFNIDIIYGGKQSDIDKYSNDASNSLEETSTEDISEDEYL